LTASDSAIRPATANDIPALHALVERAYRGISAREGWTHEADLIAGDRTSQGELRATLADPDSLTLVAQQGGALIGTVTVTRVPPDRCYLGMLGVDPQRQAGGIGRRLVAAAEEAARGTFGASIMEMTVIASRTELVDWYLRLGYGHTGETRMLEGDAGRLHPMQVLVRQL
jgi:ribosomal protein S18 acetylase RimI-like enzyme